MDKMREISRADYIRQANIGTKTQTLETPPPMRIAVPLFQTRSLVIKLNLMAAVRVSAKRYGKHRFQKLLVFERKILRKIFGPTRENQLWRIKTNNKLNKSIKHQNIVNYIKALRLSWFGHVQRMPDFRTAKKIFKWTPQKEDKRKDGKTM